MRFGRLYLFAHGRYKEALIADFDIPAGTPVKASPFVFENSLPYQEYFAERPKLKQLMGLLDSQPFFIREVSDGYEVF